jgi:hypothetical protein
MRATWVLLVAALLVGTCGRSCCRSCGRPADFSQLRVALFNEATETILRLAELRQGPGVLPARHFVANADEAHAGVLSGLFDLVGMSCDDTLAVSVSPHPNASQVRMLDAVHNGNLQLVAARNIFSVDQLRGKRIAIDTATGYARLLLAILRWKHGLVAGVDFSLVYYGATNVRYSGLVKGDFEATLLCEHFFSNFFFALILSCDSGSFHCPSVGRRIQQTLFYSRRLRPLAVSGLQRTAAYSGTKEGRSARICQRHSLHRF